MKTTLIALAALPLVLLAADASAETPKHVRDWMTKTSDSIARQLPSSVDGAAVALKVNVGSNRRINSATVVGTSGSQAQDDAAARAARRLRVTAPPTELLGRNVTLVVTPGGSSQAGATGSH